MWRAGSATVPPNPPHPFLSPLGESGAQHALRDRGQSVEIERLPVRIEIGREALALKHPPVDIAELLTEFLTSPERRHSRPGSG